MQPLHAHFTSFPPASPHSTAYIEARSAFSAKPSLSPTLTPPLRPLLCRVPLQCWSCWSGSLTLTHPACLPALSSHPLTPLHPLCCVALVRLAGPHAHPLSLFPFLGLLALTHAPFYAEPNFSLGFNLTPFPPLHASHVCSACEACWSQSRRPPSGAECSASDEGRVAHGPCCMGTLLLSECTAFVLCASVLIYEGQSSLQPLNLIQ